MIVPAEAQDTIVIEGVVQTQVREQGLDSPGHGIPVADVEAVEVETRNTKTRQIDATSGSGGVESIQTTAHTQTQASTLKELSRRQAGPYENGRCSHDGEDGPVRTN